MEILLGAAVVVLIALLLFFRRRNARSMAADEKPASQGRSRVATKSTPYHAVSIKFTGNACAAAREMSGKRFLSGAAPRLPLADCNVLECRCRFVHHSDRRTETDRRSQFRGGLGLGGETGKHVEERRSRPDRRSSGEEEDFFG